MLFLTPNFFIYLDIDIYKPLNLWPKIPDFAENQRNNKLMCAQSEKYVILAEKVDDAAVRKTSLKQAEDDETSCSC